MTSLIFRTDQMCKLVVWKQIYGVFENGIVFSWNKNFYFFRINHLYKFENSLLKKLSHDYLEWNSKTL